MAHDFLKKFIEKQTGRASAALVLTRMGIAAAPRVKGLGMFGNPRKVMPLPATKTCLDAVARDQDSLKAALLRRTLVRMAIEICRLETPEDVAGEAARRIVDAADAAIAERGRFIWALSGGETPRPTFCRLAQPDMREDLRWADTILLWSDERCVPPDDEGSNYRMAREALLDHVPIPADNILRIRGENCPIAEDERYERALHRLLDAPPTDGRIDLTLLGVGTDGHTASLFPNSPALVERRRWVLPAAGPEPYPRRITLTLPIINASRAVIVLATGSRKAPIVRGLLDSPSQATARWPIASVKPRDALALWLVDRAAHP